MKNKYIAAYELSGDVIDANDPRRSDIIAEMQAIEQAETVAEAAAVVEWWGCWDNHRKFRSAKAFCAAVRRFLRRAAKEETK
jgi:hypothetical protein